MHIENKILNLLFNNHINLNFIDLRLFNPYKRTTKLNSKLVGLINTNTPIIAPSSNALL